MNKKNITIISIILIIVLLGVFIIIRNNNNNALNNDEINPKALIGKSSNLRKERDLKYIEDILKYANVDNVDILISWIKEFNKASDDECGIVEDWTDTNKLSYDKYACADRWEKDHEDFDNDCRMTAFLLLNNHLNMKKTIDKNGNYLMFDIDAIDNNDTFKLLKDNRNKFITLFNEMNVKNLSNEEIKNAYNKKWKDYGITMENSNVSLISVVLHDNYDNVLFVGHAGILIKLDDYYMFFEKIAFLQPYQVTIFKEKEELKEMLFNRQEYFGDKTEEGPFIYENDKLIYSYK